MPLRKEKGRRIKGKAESDRGLGTVVRDFVPQGPGVWGLGPLFRRKDKGVRVK